MGYAMAMGPCFGCKQIFSFNPVKVPSYQGEPICESCIKRVNEKRKATGLPLWPVPSDAYEPCEEGAL